MTEKETLFSRALDKKKNADDNSMITNTNFLSMEERSWLAPLERQMSSNIRTYYYGGYDGAERTVALFIPSFYDIETDVFAFVEENEEDNPITVIKLTKDRFSSLSHRDYLGSLMGLGIKREMLGDIITNDEGCYIFCLKSIAKYICENLVKSGGGTVSCEICGVNSFPAVKDNGEIVFLSVASLRLDNVVAAAFNLSRALAVEAINKGIVYVNSLQIQKIDTLLKAGDKVVLRGRGKIIIQEQTGQSKKGRLHINIKRYI